MNTTQQVNIPFFQTMNEKAELVSPLPEWMLNNALILDAYRTMSLIRYFDQKAIALQRTGKLGTYPSSLGQEAIGTAIGYALHAEDVFVPYYRDHATQYLRGVSLADLYLYWAGDERGSRFVMSDENAPCFGDMPVAVPIATQFGHAVGIASAVRIRGEKRAVVVTGGDGASSKGDFLEALNLAGAWQLPVIFVINNNQWAISTPRSIQCHAETLAQKGIGAGIPCLQVDGNDYIAMHEQMRIAIERAHAGKGPCLIEAISYRLSDHTTADDATRYRSAEALREGWEKEPIKRLQTWLSQQGLWSPDQEKDWQQHCQQAVEEAVSKYQHIPPEPAEAMFETMYETIPFPLLNQYNEVKSRFSSISDEGHAHE